MVVTDNADVLEEATVSTEINADITKEDQEPLIEGHKKFFSQVSNLHVLMISTLVILLVGGTGVATWLLIDNGSKGGGDPEVPFHLVNRTSWGAMKPKNMTPFAHPPATYVIIIHTETLACDTQPSCSAEVREIQQYHMEKKKFDDIGYNFLIGGDGQVYEGRGWDMQGAFAREFNKKSLGVAFIGSFEKIMPPKEQLEEAQKLISVSVQKKKLATDYILLGHLQVSHTTSPGQALYDVIKSWPHWKDCYKITC